MKVQKTIDNAEDYSLTTDGDGTAQADIDQDSGVYQLPAAFADTLDAAPADAPAVQELAGISAYSVAAAGLQEQGAMAAVLALESEAEGALITSLPNRNEDSDRLAAMCQEAVAQAHAEGAETDAEVHSRARMLLLDWRQRSARDSELPLDERETVPSSEPEIEVEIEQRPYQTMIPGTTATQRPSSPAESGGPPSSSSVPRDSVASTRGSLSRPTAHASRQGSESVEKAAPPDAAAPAGSHSMPGEVEVLFGDGGSQHAEPTSSPRRPSEPPVYEQTAAVAKPTAATTRLGRRTSLTLLWGFVALVLLIGAIAAITRGAL